MASATITTKDKIIGTTEIGIGGALAYKSAEHCLPRALGIRTEYHTTSKENAKLIKKIGNYLDPGYGGKNGWAAKIKSDRFIKNSGNYVHITGVHKNDSMYKTLEKYPFLRELSRRYQLGMYKVVGNIENPKSLKNCSKKEMFTKISKAILFGNKTKVFYIPGTDSYFNSEFIPDMDDLALKCTKKLKCYNNRFSAMFAGLKEFGLKGIKESKGRSIAGAAMLIVSGLIAVKLVKRGFNKIMGKKENKHVNLAAIGKSQSKLKQEAKPDRTVAK